MAWTTEPSLPTASGALAAAVCPAPSSQAGQWIYAIGGTNNNVLATLAGYDTVHKKWSALPPMPTARAGVAAATNGGRIHVLGGFDANSNSLTTHEVYEPANDAWTTAAPLPSPRALLAAAAGPDGLIYAIGGFVQNPLATVDAYNPTTDTWVSKAPLHTTRAWHAAVAAPNGLIYAIGGATFIVGTGPTPLSSVETFNVTTNTWTTSSFSLPVATCGHAAAVDPNGFICVVGGDNPGNATPTTNVYLCNPADPGWITQPAMPGGRATLAAATGPDGLVYAIGGSDGTNPVATVDALATDKCYPIEQKIAAVQSELSTVQGDVGDLPPQDRAAAEKQIIALGVELRGLEAQLKTCRGG
jgi:Kelch motif protein